MASVAAARRSTKIGGGAHKLSAAEARLAHGSSYRLLDCQFKADCGLLLDSV